MYAEESLVCAASLVDNFIKGQSVFIPLNEYSYTYLREIKKLHYYLNHRNYSDTINVQFTLVILNTANINMCLIQTK